MSFYIHYCVFRWHSHLYNHFLNQVENIPEILFTYKYFQKEYDFCLELFGLMDLNKPINSHDKLVENLSSIILNISPKKLKHYWNFAWSVQSAYNDYSVKNDDYEQAFRPFINFIMYYVGLITSTTANLHGEKQTAIVGFTSDSKDYVYVRCEKNQMNLSNLA